MTFYAYAIRCLPYLDHMYPELQDEIDAHNFDLKFTANTDDLKTTVTDALDKLGGLSKEELLQFDIKSATDEQKEGWAKLEVIANNAFMSVDELINRLETLGIVTSESYEKLVSKFGKDVVNSLSPEALQLAYEVYDSTINSWDELIRKIKEYKSEQEDVRL